jgi:hypothetical protein
VPILRSARPRCRWLARIPGQRSALTLLLAATAPACSRHEKSAAPAQGARESAVPAPQPQRRDATVFAVFGDVLQDSMLKGQRISVRARSDTLILKGQVRDEASHGRLLEITRSHLGAFALVDSVRVGSPTPAASVAPRPDSAGEDR